EVRGDPVGVAEMRPGEGPLVLHQRLAVIPYVQPVRNFHGEPRQLHGPGRIAEPGLPAPRQEEVAELEGVEAHLRPDPLRALGAGRRRQLFQEARGGLDLPVDLLEPVTGPIESGVEGRLVRLVWIGVAFTHLWAPWRILPEAWRDPASRRRAATARGHGPGPSDRTAGSAPRSPAAPRPPWRFHGAGRGGRSSGGGGRATAGGRPVSVRRKKTCLLMSPRPGAPRLPGRGDSL